MQANLAQAIAYVNKLIAKSVQPIDATAVIRNTKDGLIEFMIISSPKRGEVDESVFTVFNQLQTDITEFTKLVPSSSPDVFVEYVSWKVGGKKHIELGIDVEDNEVTLILCDRN